MTDKLDVKIAIDDLKLIVHAFSQEPNPRNSIVNAANAAIALIERQAAQIALYGQNMRQIGALWNDTLYRQEPSDFDKQWCASKGESFIPVFVAETRPIKEIVPQFAIDNAATILRQNEIIQEQAEIIKTYAPFDVNTQLAVELTCEYWESRSYLFNWETECGWKQADAGLRSHCPNCGGKIRKIDHPILRTNHAN